MGFLFDNARKSAEPRHPAPCPEMLKKYIFEATRKQLEKPTEPKDIFNTTAKVTVFAASEAEAALLAKAMLEEKYFGCGVKLGDIRRVAENDLPVDWNYGYGDERGTGTPGDMDKLNARSVIR